MRIKKLANKTATEKMKAPIHRPIIVSSTPSHLKIPRKNPVATAHRGQNAYALTGRSTEAKKTGILKLMLF